MKVTVVNAKPVYKVAVTVVRPVAATVTKS